MLNFPGNVLNIMMLASTRDIFQINQYEVNYAALPECALFRDLGSVDRHQLPSLNGFVLGNLQFCYLVSLYPVKEYLICVLDSIADSLARVSCSQATGNIIQQIIREL